MKGEQWQRVEQLYHAALEREGNQRAGFLAQACGEDEVLLRNVERLLKAHAEAGEFLAAPALEVAIRSTVAEGGLPLTGQTISHFEILSLLGAGGMGEVYLARDRRLDRTVALKMLPPLVAQDPDRIQRFVLEAKAASALNHPNVATIYDIGHADGRSFIAMEYVEGETLSAKMGPPFDVARIVAIGMQAADALSEAHAKGITHRDIKPGNIMLTPRGQVKVLDFGLAKVKRGEESALNADTITLTDTVPGLVLGTLKYMSPEQLLGHTVDHRTDIFSLGAVLYEMATGRPPFAGTSATDTIGRILHVDPESIGQINPEVAELQRIVHRCLEKDPERRYPTARELMADLQNLQDGALPLYGNSKRRALALIAATVLVLGIAGTLLLAPTPPATGPAIESVAVLPFVSVEANPEVEYLADGITENIINNLSQLSQLRVMSRSSVFRFKGRHTETDRIGRELNVQALLTGRVSLHEQQIAISLELIDVSDSHQLWGEQYNRNLADLQSLQTEISRQVSDKLRVRLSGPEQRQLASRRIANDEAYQFYLKARFFQNQLTEEGFRKALEYFQAAVDKDPNYALAYTGLANVYSSLGIEYVAPRDYMPKAKAAALKAVELNQQLPEAHAALGIVYLVYDWDWNAAAKELQQNLLLSPQSVETFSCSLHFTDVLDRNKDAITSLQRALVSDPFSLPTNLELGCASYFGQQYDESLRRLREARTLYPGHPGISYLIGRAYGQKKMYREAIATLSEAKPLSGDWPPIAAELGYAYGASGRKVEAQRMLDELHVQSTHRYVDPYLVAMIHWSMGDKEKMFVELENAYARRSSWLPWLKAEPKWAALHSEPRFIDLMRRVGL